jgi:hypothetical protein
MKYQFYQCHDSGRQCIVGHTLNEEKCQFESVFIKNIVHTVILSSWWMKWISYSILNEQYVGASSKLILPSFSFDFHTFMGLMNSEVCVGVCGLYLRTINFIRKHERCSLAEIKATPKLLNYRYDVNMQITIFSLWHEPTYCALWIKVILAKFHIFLVDLEPYSPDLGLCFPKFYTEFEIYSLFRKLVNHL